MKASPIDFLGLRWITAFMLLLWPVPIPLISLSGKPVDLVLSDFFLVILVFYLAVIKKRSVRGQQRKFLVATSGIFLFLLALGLFGAIANSSILPFVSAIKYSKSLIAIVAGILISNMITVDRLWRYAGISSLFFSLLLVVSQFIIEGAFLPRWGRVFVGMETYGFPNSYAVFLIFPMMFLLGQFLFTRRSIFLGATIVCLTFIVFSLSRSATLAAAIFLLVVLFFNKSSSMGTIAKALTSILVLTLVFYPYLDIEVILDILGARIDRTLVGDDPLSGRLEIAREAIDLFLKRPAFGYLFESFDVYHVGHATPHNQYLEALFKTGLVGFLLYYVFLCAAILRIFNRYRLLVILEREFYLVFLAAIVAIMFSNLTQPNFTYSLSGNLAFLLIGYLATIRLGLERTSEGFRAKGRPPRH